MSDAISGPISPNQGLPGARPVERVRSDGAQGAYKPIRPAFDALLQELEQKARELATASSAVEQPAELADAVARAQDSLHAALSVQERILEAFRASVSRAQASGPPQVPAPDGQGERADGAGGAGGAEPAR